MITRTRCGTLLDTEGLLRINQFEEVMREQMKRFVQRQLTNILAIGRCSDAEEVQLSTMKAILHEQVKYQMRPGMPPCMRVYEVQCLV